MITAGLCFSLWLHRFLSGVSDSIKSEVKEGLMATKESETSVLWDINTCPVSSISDAGRVGPFINGALKNLGYSGPFTITAVGILTHISNDILRAVYSSGVSLTHVTTECLGMDAQIYRWVFRHQRRPSNFMLISCDSSFLPLCDLEKARHNVIRQFPFVQQVVPPTPVHFPVWESFLASLPAVAIDSGVLDKDAGLLCQLCFSTPNQDFESFTSHLSDNHPIHVIPESPPMVRQRKQPEASSDGEEEEATRGEF